MTFNARSPDSDQVQDITWTKELRLPFIEPFASNYNKSQKENCSIICADSRKFLTEIPDESVSCIITSPPYGELKDYGTSDQIGFGQNLEGEYFPDLENIFSELHRVAKAGASMWIVLDMMREGGETIPLPWEVINRARNSGWVFQDLVIWDKGKSLPWSNRGRFRGVCEYILLLGKGKLTNFNLDAVRDSENLSSYWVKYPERYHPDGKAPSDLWHFPIPNQGSWSNKQSRHHCPFPVGLIARMIRISTKPGDVVLDPFSGTGSVPGVSSYLGRFGLGVEINQEFVHDFDEEGFNSIIERCTVDLPVEPKKGIRNFIIDLRMQKYPKTLFSGLLRGDELNTKASDTIGAFLITSASRSRSSKNENLVSGDLGKIKLEILLKEGADFEAATNSVESRLKKAPLTLFGIQATVNIKKYTEWANEEFISSFKTKKWYVYRSGRFYNYQERIDRKKLLEVLLNELNKTGRSMPTILSVLEVAIEPPLKYS